MRIFKVNISKISSKWMGHEFACTASENENILKWFVQTEPLVFFLPSQRAYVLD